MNNRTLLTPPQKKFCYFSDLEGTSSVGHPLNSVTRFTLFSPDALDDFPALLFLFRGLLGGFLHPLPVEEAAATILRLTSKPLVCPACCEVIVRVPGTGVSQAVHLASRQQADPILCVASSKTAI